MKTASQLEQEILRLDRRGYPAYRDLKGSWDFGDYVLSIDHVQSDPFASPSDLSITIAAPGYPDHLYSNRVCRIALQDRLLSVFGQALRRMDSRKEGSGKSGQISCAKTGQEILDRSSCQIDPKTGALTLRFQVGFPARGRTITAGPLAKTLCFRLPALIRSSLMYSEMSRVQKESLQKMFELSMDQQAVRAQLEEKHLAAFVRDGSILPRQSGASDLPMQGAVPFVSTDEDAVWLDLPYAGRVRGLGIREGVALIVGGGYHGKSTLLNALEMGVYDHIPEDGREYVITRSDAVKIRAEDGRCVHHEDISAFIQSLPSGKSTVDFVSEDASGSTSQAAGVAEALESGSRLLLIDEDTSATNFMIRDALMSEVIASSEEPIIPYTERIRQLADAGVSTVLVAGSSGAYFEKADQILQMKDYRPINITDFARKKAAEAAAHTESESYPPMKKAAARSVEINRQLLGDRVKVRTNGLDTISIAREPVDIRALEQLVDSQQALAIGQMLVYAHRRLVDGQKTPSELADRLNQILDDRGFSAFGRGAMARPRKQELLAALNRMRSQDFILHEQDAA